MNIQKIILYIGSIFLLIIGIYNFYLGQTSQGVIWFILGVIFISVSPQMGRPIKAVKIRKRIVLICAILLLGIGVYLLYMAEYLSGIAWIVSGGLGVLISSMLTGYSTVQNPKTIEE